MKKKFIVLLFLIVIILSMPLVLTSLFQSKKNRNPSIQSDIQIRYTKNDMTNTLDFETYLIGVVAACMPAGYELDALKAQSVIARTYAYYNMQSLTEDHTLKPEYSVEELALPYLDLSDLKYIWGNDEYLTYYSKIENAVYATKDEIMTYQGEVILPMFFSNGSGYTRNAEDVLGGSYPYLVSVETKTDVTSTNYMTISEYSIEEIIQKLAAYNSSIVVTKDNFFRDVSIQKRDNSEYVLKVLAHGTALSGEEFAHILCLCSSQFSIEEYKGKVRIINIGVGHGIGLSQYGANEMAKNSSSYEEILCHYYTGVTLSNLTD